MMLGWVIRWRGRGGGVEELPMVGMACWDT